MSRNRAGAGSQNGARSCGRTSDAPKCPTYFGAGVNGPWHLGVASTQRKGVPAFASFSRCAATKAFAWPKKTSGR